MFKEHVETLHGIVRRPPSGVAAAAPLSHKERLCASFSIFLIRYLEIQSFFVRLLWPLKKVLLDPG
jgi:hypothetical protein